MKLLTNEEIDRESNVDTAETDWVEYFSQLREQAKHANDLAQQLAAAREEIRRWERDVLADVLDKVLSGRLCWLRSEAAAFIADDSEESYGPAYQSGEEFLKRFVVFCQNRAALSTQSAEQATAKTKREIEMEDLLRSARAIAERKGEGTHWGRFSSSIAALGIGTATARTYRILPHDLDESGATP